MDWITQNKDSLRKILSDYISFFPEIEKHYLNIEQRKDSDDNKLFNFFQNFMGTLSNGNKLYDSLIRWALKEKKRIMDFEESHSKWQYDFLEEFETVFKILINSFPIIQDLNENLNNNIPIPLFDLHSCLEKFMEITKTVDFLIERKIEISHSQEEFNENSLESNLIFKHPVSEYLTAEPNLGEGIFSDKKTEFIETDDGISFPIPNNIAFDSDAARPFIEDGFDYDLYIVKRKKQRERYIRE